MAFKKSNQWQVVNRFTLRDGDRLHTCVPQMLIMKIGHMGARYSLTRDRAVTDGEASPQNLRREIVGSGNFDNAGITVFSTDIGAHGFTGAVSWRILPGTPENMQAAARVSLMSGFEHSGLSAKVVPENGLMGPQGGLLTALHKTDCNPPWVFELALFMPQDHFEVLFNAIASGPTPPSQARMIMRANLFETEVDAALNEGRHSYGFMVESSDSTMGSTAAMLDDLDFSIAPTGHLP